MRKCILLLVTGLLAGSLNAQIYKWTDSAGNVHFSDEPRPGAEKVELPEVQTFSAPPLPPTPQPSQSFAGNNAEAIDYTVNILSPDDQATIRNNDGFVSVMIEVNPKLAANDKLQIVFDGTPLGSPKATTVFALRDINRGSHTIAAQLIDTSGKIVTTSEEVTIYMHRPRVGMVPQTRPANRAP